MVPYDWTGDPEGATPLDDEQRACLIPSWVSTRGDLNEVEADNIHQARRRWRRKLAARGGTRMSVGVLLNHFALRELHRDMFGDVWSWAGKYRTTDTNIGISCWQIPTSVLDLTEDAKYWFSAAEGAGVEKFVCRFHHKLVEIHAFPNGNGRHAREMTDLLLLSQRVPVFTWGQTKLVNVSHTRRDYINALRSADRGDYAPLENFVRT